MCTYTIYVECANVMADSRHCRHSAPVCIHNAVETEPADESHSMSRNCTLVKIVPVCALACDGTISAIMRCGCMHARLAEPAQHLTTWSHGSHTQVRHAAHTPPALQPAAMRTSQLLAFCIILEAEKWSGQLARTRFHRKKCRPLERRILTAAPTTSSELISRNMHGKARPY